MESAAGVLTRAAIKHAIGRLGSGFNLVEVVSEYRALRAGVLHLWRQTIDNADERDLQDLTVSMSRSINRSPKR